MTSQVKRGRPISSTKDPSRRKIYNHNGRLIDYDGPQFNMLLKNGYKINDAG